MDTLEHFSLVWCADALRFDTMPSRPILQAWANTVGPSASMWALRRRPGAARLISALAGVERLPAQIVTVQFDQVEGV